MAYEAPDVIGGSLPATNPRATSVQTAAATAAVLSFAGPTNPNGTRYVLVNTGGGPCTISIGLDGATATTPANPGTAAVAAGGAEAPLATPVWYVGAIVGPYPLVFDAGRFAKITQVKVFPVANAIVSVTWLG